MKTAERVAAMFREGRQFTTTQGGTRLDDVCEAMGGRRQDGAGDAHRWVFDDGSAIAVAGGSWAIGKAALPPGSTAGWHVDRGGLNVVAIDGRPICSCGVHDGSQADNGFGENVANARLIAAAPALLGACVNELAQLDLDAAEFLRERGESSAFIELRRGALRAVIAAARG